MTRRRQIPKVRFVLNSHKDWAESYVRMEMRVWTNAAPIKINTGFKVKPKDWDHKAMRFRDRTNKDLINNGELAKIEQAAKEVYLDGGSKLSRDQFSEQLQKRVGWIEDEGEVKKTFLEF